MGIGEAQRSEVGGGFKIIWWEQAIKGGSTFIGGGGEVELTPLDNITSYGSNSVTLIMLNTIKQWNEIHNFKNLVIYSLEMTYSKILKSVKYYIESQ